MGALGLLFFEARRWGLIPGKTPHGLWEMACRVARVAGAALLTGGCGLVELQNGSQLKKPSAGVALLTGGCGLV